MKKAIGAACLAGGIALLIFGFQSKDSFKDKANEVFTGSPTDKTMWMIGGGVALCVAGAVLVMKK
ncbi:MAG: hypothetical protein K0Q55_28 [Verrucomicrobia bacterium]|jgi:hypothetical protein|nr:hypothetical protein [Verrucomicrobiota bacterium]